VRLRWSATTSRRCHVLTRTLSLAATPPANALDAVPLGLALALILTEEIAAANPPRFAAHS
jgi:hypothetical protein